MRSITTAQEQVISSSGIARAEHVRVQVKDSGGTFRDLTTYPGQSMVDSVDWKEDLDSPGATASIRLKREVDALSLAPLMTSSALNHGFDPASSYAALLALNRELKVDVAIVPVDSTPASGDWMTVFHGRIDSIDPAGPQIAVECLDLSGRLQKAFLETEKVYAFGSVSSLPVSMRVWAPSAAYVLNEYVIPTEANRNGRFYKCTTAGTSGTTEPTWPASSTVADGAGALVWTYQSTTSTSGFDLEKVLQNLLDDALGAGVVTLYTPTSPSWAVRQWIQQRGPLLDALRALVTQRGWDIRYKWRSGTSQFELTLYGPERTSPSAARTFSSAEYKDITRLAQDMSGIRNAGRLIYPDVADLDPAGDPIRKALDRVDTDVDGAATSITNYGRLWFEISEADASQIDTAAEAATMLEAAIADMMEPGVEQEVDFVHGLPWAEVNDYYTFSADGRRYSSDQSLATFAVRHKAEKGFIQTSISCRGKPSAGFDRWHRTIVHPAIGKLGHGQHVFGSAAGPALAATPTIGGARLDVAVAADKNAFRGEFEYHVSPDAGFTPSSDTLIGVGQHRSLDIGQLLAGSLYRAAIVPRVRNGDRIVRGQKGPEAEFTAGRANPGHLISTCDWGRVPLNGSFEARSDASGMPDHWGASVAIGTNVQVYNGSSAAQSGNRYVGLYTNSATSPWIACDSFEVTAGEVYLLEVWRKCNSGSGSNLSIAILWYGNTFGFVSSSSMAVSLSDGVGTWTRSSFVGTAPSTAKYATVNALLVGDAGDTRQVDLDSFSVSKYVDTQDAWIAPLLENYWVNYDTSAFNAAGYMRDSRGFGCLRGLVKDGTATAGTVLFTLPAGHRPSKVNIFSVASADAFGECRVSSNGDVAIQAGSNAWFCLDGITFDTR